jgi:phosphatidylserine decarboxylase
VTLIQSGPFLRAYHLLPHGPLNRGFARLMRARRPRALVQAVIRRWIARAHIDMGDYLPEDYDTVEEFFLRRLRPGARPMGPGLVSPVDGHVVAVGRLDGDGAALPVKGQVLSADRVVNGRLHDLPLDGYRGGSYLVVFLSPRGYHRIHMPVAGRVTRCQWIPGRYFPQNERALDVIPAVYERNERAALACVADAGWPFVMVLVGASLVGGIELEGLPRRRWARRAPLEEPWRLGKGQELGHFRFGSTIVLLLPPGLGALRCRRGDPLQMGQSLLDL